MRASIESCLQSAASLKFNLQCTLTSSKWLLGVSDEKTDYRTVPRVRRNLFNFFFKNSQMIQKDFRMTLHTLRPPSTHLHCFTVHFHCDVSFFSFFLLFFNYFDFCVFDMMFVFEAWICHEIESSNEFVRQQKGCTKATIAYVFGTKDHKVLMCSNCTFKSKRNCLQVCPLFFHSFIHSFLVNLSIHPSIHPIIYPLFHLSILPSTHSSIFPSNPHSFILNIHSFIPKQIQHRVQAWWHISIPTMVSSAGNSRCWPSLLLLLLHLFTNLHSPSKNTSPTSKLYFSYNNKNIPFGSFQIHFTK